MPRLGDTDTDAHQLAGSNFSFTGARVEHLGATEYTLVDISVDMSGSVRNFKTDLVDMLNVAIDACRKSPRSDYLLVRVCAFSSLYSGGLNEIHGYVPLKDIDTSAYYNLDPYGGTPLFDACFVSVAAMNAYAKMLFDQDYSANGISFIITDGDDTTSNGTPAMVRAEIDRAIKEEFLESHVSVLIGINAGSMKSYLTDFQTRAGITRYIDAGDANKGNLAKLAAFVSQSISSTSQALGTGGPSQSIAAVI